MKAYCCQNIWEICSTIVFAESAGKARYIAMNSDSIGDDLEFKDVRVRRVPQLDKYYHGLKEMNWYNSDDRFAMIRFAGFQCNEDTFEPYECKDCSGKEYCDRYKDYCMEMEE